MGARASIQFQEPSGQKSIVLFSHWGGDDFVDQAKDYVKQLKKDIKTGKLPPSGPLARLEADRVIIDFVRHLTKDLERVDSDYYLVATEGEGDNSDYGHHIIRL